MVMRINRAFDVSRGLTFDDELGVFHGAGLPWEEDDGSTPVGSVYIRIGGGLYQKTSPGTEAGNWVDQANGGSGGVANELDGSVLTVIDYSIADKVLVLVDTTNQPVSIYLPDASIYLNKFFHVKWWKGLQKNRVQLIAQTGQVVDGQNLHKLGGVYDSLQVVGASATEWAIV